MLAQTLYKLRDGLVALAYPQMCRLCQSSVESLDDGVVCASCWEDQQITPLFFQQAGCGKCGAPLSINPQFLTAENLPSECDRCRKMPFTCARSCGSYAGALEANILFLKSHPHLCRRLRRLLRQTFATHRNLLMSDVVMPVPLHPERERQRGFNQAALIAKFIAREFQLRLDCHSLQRVKNTEKHRIGMDAVDRAKSVEKAFQINGRDMLAGASVLLIDDVFTTGSTVSEVTATLRKAGAAEAKLFTIARVINVH